jgi:hypothetical protein
MIEIELLAASIAVIMHNIANDMRREFHKSAFSYWPTSRGRGKEWIKKGKLVKSKPEAAQQIATASPLEALHVAQDMHGSPAYSHD